MSVIADFQVSGQNPSVVGGLGNLPKYFPRILGSSIGVSASPSPSNAAGQLVIPAVNAVHGSIFKVKIGGDALATAGLITIDLVANTGTIAAPVYVAIATLTGTPALATAVNWFIETTLNGDNNSGLLSGYYTASMNNATFSPAAPLAAITNPPSGLDFVKGQNVSGMQGGVIGLAVRAAFATSSAQNVAHLTQFQVVAD